MKRNSGVTLIELVMAMVILAIVAIPTAAMIGGQIKGTLSSQDLTMAGNLARNDMELLNNLAQRNISNISGTNYSSGQYDVTRAVNTTSGSSATMRKDIAITVNRHGSSSALAVIYASLASNSTYQT